MKDAHVYTVSQLTQEIRALLEEAYGEVWVEGEVSNFVHHSSGHCYFSLKDENSVISAVLFKSYSSKLKIEIENGQKVICRGRVSVYDKRGQYQFYVTKLEPVGVGALQVAFEKLKKKLYEEGLFDEAKKKSLPALPVCIGIVTSPTGAAVKDMLKVAKRRFSNLEIIIRPVRVQGDEAKGEIAEAIKELNEYNATKDKYANPIDVIIVGRGGGSLEDLWPFNEEIVARAIYDSEIPIVSAVGHEIDYTISDFVADLRAPTPSAAAELVIPLREDIFDHINECLSRIRQAIKMRLEDLSKEVKRLKESYILRTPTNVVLQLQQQVDDLISTANLEVKHLIELKESALSAAGGMMKALSPVSVLERGYSITYKNGKIIKNSKFLKKGDILKTKFHEGIAESTVKDLK